MSWAFRFCLEVYFFLLPRAVGPPFELFDKTNAVHRPFGFDYFARLTCLLGSLAGEWNLPT
jgi:hypothetical protein